MKIKNILLDIFIAVLAIIPMLLPFIENKINENPSTSMGMTAGFSFGILFAYFNSKSQIYTSTQDNSQKIIDKWRKMLYILFGINAMVFFMYHFGFFQNNLVFSVLPFFMLMVFGNYQPIISPDANFTFSAYLEDEEVRIKTKRLLAKISFFGGVIGIILCFFVPEKKLMIFFGFYGLLVMAAAYFYPKYLFNKKYA